VYRLPTVLMGRAVGDRAFCGAVDSSPRNDLGTMPARTEDVRPNFGVARRSGLTGGSQARPRYCGKRAVPRGRMPTIRNYRHLPLLHRSLRMALANQGRYRGHRVLAELR
jgi:hypothetical protein